MEKEQNWYFTFCGDHLYPNGYAKFFGTYSSARRDMVAHFGIKWGFQYPSEEKAGVKQFNLKLIN